MFEETGLFFKVTIYNSEMDEEPISADKTPINFSDLSDDEIRVVEYLRSNQFINNTIVRELTNKKDTTAKVILKKLVDKNIIEAVGERRNRKYIIVKGLKV